MQCPNCSDHMLHRHVGPAEFFATDDYYKCPSCGGSVKYGENLDKPVMYVIHRQIKRASSESPYRSHCLRCDHGLMFVQRNPETLELLPDDHCICCGQRYHYMDIHTMRFL